VAAVAWPPKVADLDDDGGGTDADDVWEQELGVLMQLPSPDLA
jgi:hypothetical protein